MAKVMIVMEEPVSCGECPCSCEDYCQKESDIIPDVKTKPEWCPLRKVPQMKDENKAYDDCEYYRMQGYNDCLEEIIGGENNE